MINSFLAYLTIAANLKPFRINLRVRTRLTTRLLWAAGIMTVIFTYVNMSQITPNDFWWHMAVGRDTILNGQIPAVDFYSYTMAGKPYLSYQMFWLMDLWLYGWYSLGGAEMILFIQSLIITATYLIILLLCWQNSKSGGLLLSVYYFRSCWGFMPGASGHRRSLS